MTPIEISSLIVKRTVMKLLYLIDYKERAQVDICFLKEHFVGCFLWAITFCSN